jgi:hypothetical protein
VRRFESVVVVNKTPFGPSFKFESTEESKRRDEFVEANTGRRFRVIFEEIPDAPKEEKPCTP